ncbi:MAG: hypothetical protein A2Y77_03825 [Planctomycetes bacterium RBG_13_62_9]|nr:MAG: hypothetical protein A2Y77_03825 [Planctomycetes bacterium RBG_13_62_9]
MAKYRSHDAWMAKQFKLLKRPRGEILYRDALLHASFIEGIVRNTSNRRRPNFHDDIQWLYIHKKITDKERHAFHEVREARNKLVHRIVTETASQEQIEQWRDDLMNRVLKAYWMSPFLNDELFTKYNIAKSDLPRPGPAA